jgi:hypothetical protein
MSAFSTAERTVKHFWQRNKEKRRNGRSRMKKRWRVESVDNLSDTG